MRSTLPAALIVAAFAIGVRAQDLRITNLANVARKQWVDVAVPLSDAAALPALCRVDPMGFIAWKGANVGLHSTLFHVLATLQPRQTVTGNLVGVPTGGDAWAMSDWVADDTPGVLPIPG